MNPQLTPQEKLEFCWNYRQKKSSDQIDMTEGNYTSGICLSCQKEQKEKLEATGAKVIDTLGEPEFSVWYSKIITYRYISVQANNGKVLKVIRRFVTIAPHYDTFKVFTFVNQLIANNYQWILYYGDLELLKTKDFWWYISKNGDFYKIGGNCFEYSNAFWLETLDIDLILNLIEKWTPLQPGLREHVKQQINKGLTFASNPKAFEREKILCFQDYSDYNKTREPKTTIIKNYHPTEVKA